MAGELTQQEVANLTAVLEQIIYVRACWLLDTTPHEQHVYRDASDLLACLRNLPTKASTHEEVSIAPDIEVRWREPLTPAMHIPPGSQIGELIVPMWMAVWRETPEVAAEERRKPEQQCLPIIYWPAAVPLPPAFRAALQMYLTKERCKGVSPTSQLLRRMRDALNTAPPVMLSWDAEPYFLLVAQTITDFADFTLLLRLLGMSPSAPPEALYTLNDEGLVEILLTVAEYIEEWVFSANILSS